MIYVPSRDILLPSRPLLPYLPLWEYEQGTKPWHKSEAWAGWAPGRPWFPGKDEREAGFHCMPAGIVTHRRALRPSAVVVGPAATPMHFWRLEEASGNRADSGTVAGFDLTPTGVPGNAAALIGNGVSLNGTTQHLDWGGTQFPLGIGVSVTAWIWGKITSFNASECGWISQNNGSFTQGWFVGDNGTGGKTQLYAATISNGLKSVSGSVTLTSGTWFFLVFRYDSAAKTAYVRLNDSSQSSVGTVSDLAAGGALAIGNGQESIFPNGLFDAAAYFDSSLSAADITAGFNGGIGAEYYSGAWH